MSQSAILFKNVSRHFGEVKAVDDVTLEIMDGEFFSMLGPSGSGKTTCLRMIAGFDRPSHGQIFLYGQDVFPEKRGLLAVIGLGGPLPVTLVAPEDGVFEIGHQLIAFAADGAAAMIEMEVREKYVGDVVAVKAVFGQ